MSVAGGSELRKRKSNAEIPKSTEDFSGYTLWCDTSPTATPAQTRSGSPMRVTTIPHTTAQTSQFMNSLRFLASKNALSKSTMVSVGEIDGSANVSTITKTYYLIVYFLLNLALTLYNKAVMIQFPFPFLLTALHTAAGAFGTTVLLSAGYFPLTPVTAKDSSVLLAFSVLYTANIAISNVSLHMVTIPFHQVLRATSPIFIILIYGVVYRSTYSPLTYLSLLPVILGVGLATYGDFGYTWLGFAMTLLGAILASVKTVVTNRIQTAGMHLGALEMLYRMCPLALVQSLAMGYLRGEIGGLIAHIQTSKCTKTSLLVVLVNALMAFSLNLASFSANKKVGALAMTVAANVKQILTVLLAILFWKLEVGWVNALGIALTLIGGAFYAYVEMRAMKGRWGRVLEEGKRDDRE